MSKLFGLVMTIFNFTIPFFKLNYRNIFIKIALYFIATIFLISFYIFACVSLYNFLIPYWGEALSALSLCFLFLISTIGFIFIAHRLKVKKKVPPPQLLPALEKNMDSLLNIKELQKFIKKNPSAIPIAMVGVFSLFSLFSFLNKKNK
jgi:hypothetical protein